MPMLQIIHPSDSLILSTEANPYEDTCYQPTYRLSDPQLHALALSLAPSQAPDPSDPSPHRDKSWDFKGLFGGRYLLNWAIFSSPRNPLLLQLLHNMVTLPLPVHSLP